MPSIYLWTDYETTAQILTSPARRFLVSHLSQLHGGAAVPASKDPELFKLRMLEGWDRLPGEPHRCLTMFHHLTGILGSQSVVSVIPRSVIDDLLEFEP